MNALANPYVGPRTFEKTEKDRFFGREREKRELLALTVSEQLVLFYAQSGAGKSSLINTCLIPDLESKGYSVLPVGRVVGDPPSELNVGNIYIFNLISKMAANDINLNTLANLSLCEFLSEKKYIPVSEAAMKDTPAQERIVLIIDQFEELFSTHPEQWVKRQDFFAQLAQALEELPYLWVILVMREDFIALLEPYEYLLPGRLRVRYYMQRLGREAALKAIKMPAENLRPYTDDVAEKLVDDLRGVQVGYKPDGTPDIKPGQYVEAVQLQVVCSNLWKNLKSDGDQITEADLRAVGDVNTSLGNYYAERVKEVAETYKVSERKIRDWFTDKLISSNGVRTPVLKDQDGKSGGLEGYVIDALHDLVRTEPRGGATFYELTHDRLVAPIVANNQQWRDENFSPLQRQAWLWNDQKKNEKWLLKDQALEDVQTWADEHQNEVTPLEKEFLEACRRKQDEAKLLDQERSTRRLRRNIAAISILAVIAIFAAAVAFSFGTRASQAAATANAANTKVATAVIALETAQTDALNLAADASNSATLAGAGKLAVLSSTVNDPQLSLLLAISASEKAHQGGQTNILIAYDALRKAFEDTQYRQLKGHTALISMVAFSPDGHWLASGSYDGTIRLWDMVNPASNPVVLSGQTSFAYNLAFSPNGHWLAATGNDNTIRVWDMTNLTAVPKLLSGHTDGINSLAFSPDNAWLASGSSDNTVRLWDMANLNLDPVVLKGHTGPVYSLSFSRKEPVLASAGDDGTVRIWNLNDPASDPTVLTGSPDSLYSVNFSPDGHWLASGGKASAVLLWDRTTPSSAPRVLSVQSSPIYAVIFSPNGHWLASRSATSIIQVWDMTGTNPSVSPISFSLNGQTSVIDSLAFSPDNQWLVSGSDDGIVFAWNMTAANLSSSPTKLSEQIGSVYALAFSPDSHWLASGSYDATVRIWDVTSQFGKETLINTYDVQGTLPAVADPITGLSFSPDGSWLTSVDANHNAQIWNFQNGIPKEPLVKLDTPVHSFIYDPQSLTLFAGSEQANTIYYWPLGKEYPEHSDIKFPDHKGALDTLVYFNCPTGSCWASANDDDTVTYWRGNESSTLNGKRKETIKSLAISPDNRWLAAGGESGTISVWSRAIDQGDTKKELWTKLPVFLYQKKAVNALAFSQDGHWLAGEDEDGTISVWDVAGTTIPSKEIFQFHGPPGPLHALTFSPRGRWLASGGNRSVILLWDLANLESGAKILQTKNKSVYALAFSADGRWLASGGDNGVIEVWGPDSTKLAETACQIVGRNLEWQEWISYFGSDSQTYQVICPTNPFPASVADHFLREGDKLAQDGNITDAILKYQDALKRCPAIQCPGFVEEYIPDPGMRANHERAVALVNTGDSRARNGDSAGAIQQYKQAIRYDPSVLEDNETPETRVDRINNTVLKQQISDLYYSGDYKGAATKLMDAQKASPNHPIMTAEDANLLNEICWYGTPKYAVEVKDVCELVGVLAPENGDFRDSRAVNRAMLGNLSGAIQDFNYAISWWAGNNSSDSLIQERKAWLKLLNGGHNPFEEKMVFVHSGAFTMGNDDGQPNERPAHTVNLDSFLIDQTEVTNKMYSKCVSEGGCKPPNSLAPPQVTTYYGDPQFDNYPVIYMDWARANNYCKWAGRRLPTEAEWEKAARGENAFTYPWGNDPPNSSLLNYHKSEPMTTTVGSYPNGASPYGALDMAGNVWEWVNDFYSDTYYARSKNSTNPTGPRVTDFGIVRGGAWNSSDTTITTTYRNAQGKAGTTSEIGFRCAMSVP